MAGDERVRYIIYRKCMKRKGRGGDRGGEMKGQTRKVKGKGNEG